MPAGDYRDRVRHHICSRPVTTSTGSTPDTFAAAGWLWCRIEEESGRRETEVGGIVSGAYATIRLRGYPPVSALDRLSHCGRVWVVDSVYRGDYELVCDCYQLDTRAAYDIEGGGSLGGAVIKGRIEVQLNDLGFKRGEHNKRIRIALNAAAASVKADVVAEAPSGRLGALKKSIRIKTKFYKSSNTWAAIIGPSRKYQRKRKGKVVRPARYAHLVERGTKRAAARPFVGPAMARGRAAFIMKFNSKLKELLAN